MERVCCVEAGLLRQGGFIVRAQSRLTELPVDVFLDLLTQNLKLRPERLDLVHQVDLVLRESSR